LSVDISATPWCAASCECRKRRHRVQSMQPIGERCEHTGESTHEARH
jgi:hypothetical protein